MDGLEWFVRAYYRDDDYYSLLPAHQIVGEWPNERERETVHKSSHLVLPWFIIVIIIVDPRMIIIPESVRAFCPMNEWLNIKPPVRTWRAGQFPAIHSFISVIYRQSSSTTTHTESAQGVTPDVGFWKPEEAESGKQKAQPVLLANQIIALIHSSTGIVLQLIVITRKRASERVLSFCSFCFPVLFKRDFPLGKTHFGIDK